MAFWATTWEKTASAAATAEEQLARLQDGVVQLETKIGNEDTEDTLSHDVATLQIKVGDGDIPNTLSYDVATLKKNKLYRSGGSMRGDLSMGYRTICHLRYDGISVSCPVPRLWIDQRIDQRIDQPIDQLLEGCVRPPRRSG